MFSFFLFVFNGSRANALVFFCLFAEAQRRYALFRCSSFGRGVPRACGKFTKRDEDFRRWGECAPRSKGKLGKRGVCGETCAVLKSVVREDGQSAFRKKIRTRRCGADVKRSVRLAARAVPLLADRLSPAFSCGRLPRLHACGACPSRTIRRAVWSPF